MTSWIDSLSSLPNGYEETQALLSDFDHCFVVGFANLSSAQWETLGRIEQIVDGTPLAQPFTAAVAALRSNTFTEPPFVALAAARVSLQGALHDALLGQLRAALGRPQPAADAQPLTRSELPLLASVRHWLVELVLPGFGRLDADTLSSFSNTLDTLQADPTQLPLAALLTGLRDELLRHNRANDIPSYRWVDLWTQAMIASLGQHEQAAEPASGSLELLGMDVRASDHTVSFVLHGVLTAADDSTRHVCITQSAWRVDAIRGDEVWLLFPHAKNLLSAYSASKQLTIDAMPLLTTGDLIWDDERANMGKKFKWLQRAQHYFAADGDAPRPTTLPPLGRHPIQIAEPVFIDVRNDNALPWSLQRAVPGLTLEPDVVATAGVGFGLLRFDNGTWSFQPLAVGQSLLKMIRVNGEKAGKLASKPPKKSTVSLLQERASRLLRAS